MKCSSCQTGDSIRPVTSDDLSRLSYLTRIVKESLRIIPAVPMVARSLDEDVVLGKVNLSWTPPYSPNV